MVNTHDVHGFTDTFEFDNNIKESYLIFQQKSIAPDGTENAFLNFTVNAVIPLHSSSAL